MESCRRLSRVFLVTVCEGVLLLEWLSSCSGMCGVADPSSSSSSPRCSWTDSIPVQFSNRLLRLSGDRSTLLTPCWGLNSPESSSGIDRGAGDGEFDRSRPPPSLK